MDMMTKNDKIRNRALGLTALMTLWIILMSGLLLDQLKMQRTMEQYLETLTQFTLRLNTYYQNVIDKSINEATGNEFLNFEMDRQDSMCNEIELILNDLTEEILDLELLESNGSVVLGEIESSFQLMRYQGVVVNDEDLILKQSKMMHIINDDISLLINIVRQRQREISKDIHFELIVGFSVLITLTILSNGWLLIHQTLIPLEKMRQSFNESALGYQTETLIEDKDDEIGALTQAYNFLRNRTLAIEKLNHKLNDHDHFEEIVDFIFDHFKSFIPYNRIGIAVLSSDQSVIRALSARSDRPIKLGENYEYPIKMTSLQSIIDSGDPRILNDLETYYASTPQSESTGLILKEGMLSSVTMPLIVRKRCVGVVFFSSSERNVYDNRHVQFLETIAESLASSFDHSFLNDQLVVSTIQGFARLVESKDSETGNHIERMQAYSVLIAEILRTEGHFDDVITDTFIKQVRDFSPLHDIGKVAVPDKILLKPGKLTGDEFEVIKAHAAVGGDILQDMNDQIHGEHRNFYKVGIEIARYHHEKYNGTGYPDHLVGEAIPLSARIVAVADVFDALTSKRTYKEAFTIEKAQSILIDGQNQHFDPLIIDAVMKNWSRFENQADIFHSIVDNEQVYLIS